MLCVYNVFTLAHAQYIYVCVYVCVCDTHGNGGIGPRGRSHSPVYLKITTRTLWGIHYVRSYCICIMCTCVVTPLANMLTIITIMLTSVRMGRKHMV